MEHFDELLNRPTVVDFDILDDIERLSIMNHFDNLITMEELNTALKNIKLKKSPGPDGLLPEVLVHGGNNLRSLLLKIFNAFWVTESVPSDMIDANIFILFKKGDRSQCGNYRGISLLSVAGKIFSDIILQRLKSLADIYYPEAQSGYRDGS